MKHPKFNQSGVTHILAPLVFIAIFAGIGALVLRGSHAQVVTGGGGGYTNGKIYSGNFTINPDGSGFTSISTPAVYNGGSSNMSFDGTQVAYTATNPSSPIAFTLLNKGTISNANTTGYSLVNTSTISNLPTGVGVNVAPLWSPDGTKVAVSLGGKIWVANTSGTAGHVIPNVPSTVLNSIGWRPGSENIVYVPASLPTATGSSICTVSIGGVKYGCHTIALGNVKVAGQLGNSPNDGLAVSPTGGNVALVAINYPVQNYTPSMDIYTVDPYGNGLKRLTALGAGQQVDSVVWSPDGTKIAYLLYDASNSTSSATGLYVMNADGSGKTRIKAETYSTLTANSLSWAHK